MAHLVRQGERPAREELRRAGRREAEVPVEGVLLGGELPAGERLQLLRERLGSQTGGSPSSAWLRASRAGIRSPRARQALARQ